MTHHTRARPDEPGLLEEERDRADREAQEHDRDGRPGGGRVSVAGVVLRVHRLPNQSTQLLRTLTSHP